MRTVFSLSAALPSLAVTLAGVFCTLLLAQETADWESEREGASFKIMATARADAVASALHLAEAELLALVSFSNALEHDITRDQYLAYSSGLRARTPFVRASGYYVRVLDRERASFERARQAAAPGYSILEPRENGLTPAARRPYYRVIEFVEPFEPMARAIGVDADMVSPRLKPATLAAARTGKTHTSGLFNMLVDGQAQVPHVLLLAPLYRGAPADALEREAALHGWVSVVLRVRDLVQATEAGRGLQPGQRVELYAGEDGAWTLAHAAHGSADTAHGLREEQSFERSFEVANREWKLRVMAPRPGLVEAHLGSLLIASIGLMLTLALAFYLYSLRSRSDFIARLVAERTDELNHANDRLVSDIATREAQNRILHTIAAGGNLDAIIEQILRFTESRLSSGHVYMLLRPGSGQAGLRAWTTGMQPRLLDCLIDAGEAFLGWVQQELDHGSLDFMLRWDGQAWRQAPGPAGEKSVTDQCEKLQASLHPLALAGIRSLSAWPVRDQSGELLGSFLLLRSKPTADSAEERRMASICIDLAGIVIESRRAEERIRHLAHHDELTGLPNRLTFTEHLQRALLRARRDHQEVAVMFVDLDRFKNVNDSFGHDAGDEVLRCLALAFRSCLRTPDVLARIGGDEFIVLLENYAGVQQLSEIAERLLAEGGRPFHVAGQECTLSASIGIAVYPDDGQDANTLVKHADVAMYRAKTIGRNNYQFFSPEMNGHAVNRLALESSLRRGLERQEIVVHYQPKVDLRRGRIVGCEALVRWQQGPGELVLPGLFVPLAEEIGLISSIGRQVLETACRDLAAMQARGVDCGRIAINLSGLQFNDAGLVQQVKELLTATGALAQRLEFEITESMVMHNRERAIGLMEGLRGLGIALSVDDFGTGYSSLASLKRFPVDSVKIDRSFIADISQDSNDVAIVNAIISMAHSLGLKVIAEGVENSLQLDTLRRFDCDQYQGFHYSAALPLDDFIDLVTRQPVATLPA